MTDYLHSGANKMNKVEAYKNDNKLLLADKLGHAKVSSLKEQNLLNTIATVQQHSNKITQLETDANKVRGAYVYKGTVETEFDLPLNNNSVGDVYNTFSTGMNYAWNGENWDELGNFTSILNGLNQQIIQAIAKSELRLVWDNVPIYNVTLAENISATSDAPYVIDNTALEGTYRALYIIATLPTVLAGNCYCNGILTDQTRVRAGLRTTSTYCTTLFWRKGNMLTNKIVSGNSELAIKQIYEFGGTPVLSDEDFSGFTIYGQTLPTGMTITVYGAQEVE